MKVGIVNYGLGNVKSVKSSFEFLGYDAFLCQSESDFNETTHTVLPGVGSFNRAINLINEMELKDVLQNEVINKKKPTLGICLGLQLMAKQSFEYGVHKGFSWFEGDVVKLPETEKNLKLPNIGWETVKLNGDSLFKGLSEASDFYFVHSYHIVSIPEEQIIATYKLGEETIVAAIKCNNIVATQFHPEKSQDNGLKLIENFMQMK